MKKTPFFDITVTEVCKQTQINRRTIYLHYFDLWAVLDELEEEALRDESPERTIVRLTRNNISVPMEFAIRSTHGQNMA